MTTRLVERYGHTGHVVFTGPDYELAKIDLDVMEQLSRIVDAPTALAAADWAELKVNELASACQAPAAQEVAA